MHRHFDPRGPGAVVHPEDLEAIVLGITIHELALLNELAATEAKLKELLTRRSETEFALSERKRRYMELKETAARLENPGEVANRDESAVRKDLEDLRSRLVHHEKEIGELEKTLAAVQSETLTTEKAVASLRDRLLAPMLNLGCPEASAGINPSTPLLPMATH